MNRIMDKYLYSTLLEVIWRKGSLVKKKLQHIKNWWKCVESHFCRNQRRRKCQPEFRSYLLSTYNVQTYMTTSNKRMQHLFMNKVLLSEAARHFTWSHCQQPLWWLTCTHSADYTHLLSLTLIKSPAHIPQLLIPPVPDCSLPHRTIRWSLCLKPSNWTLYVPDLSVCPQITCPYLTCLPASCQYVWVDC